MVQKKRKRRPPAGVAFGPRHGNQVASDAGERVMDHGTPWTFHSSALKAASDQAAQERQSFHDALSNATMTAKNLNQGSFPKASLLGKVEVPAEKEKS